jgi:hypothetical protein
MFKIYKEHCESINKPAFSRTKYTEFFKSLNIGFHKPKKDQCQKCRRYHEANPDEKEALKEHYDVHIKEKDLARKAKNEDTVKAITDKSGTFVYFNFDKEAVLSTPQLPDQPVLYKRKLCTYNVTTYDVANKAGWCYVWSEYDGSRGSNEVATILYRNIKKYESAEHITMFSDTYGGENRNSQMAIMAMHIVQEKPNLKVLEQKFFESGHSTMEADSMHSTIQQKCRKSSPEGLEQHNEISTHQTRALQSRSTRVP